MRAFFLRVAAGLALAASGLSGCSAYHFRDQVEGGLYPAQFHSVAVPIAANRSFWPGAEFDLTEAVIKEISHRTPYAVVGKSGADSQLNLTIVDIHQNAIARRQDGGPQELEFCITVNMEWVDTVTGRPFRSFKGLMAPAIYMPAVGANESYQTAQREAVERLARDIVDAMRVEWQVQDAPAKP